MELTDAEIQIIGKKIIRTYNWNFPIPKKMFQKEEYVIEQIEEAIFHYVLGKKLGMSQVELSEDIIKTLITIGLGMRWDKSFDIMARALAQAIEAEFDKNKGDN